MPTPRPPATGRTSPATIVSSATGRFSLRGAEAEQRMTRGGGRLSNRRAAAREAGAAARTSRVRAARGITVDDGHPSRLDAELLRCHLGDRDTHAGSDVHLARVDRHRAVSVDRKKAVDFSGIEGTAITAERARWRHLLADRRQSAESEADDQAAGGLQPIAPVDVVTQRSRHVRWILSEVAATGANDVEPSRLLLILCSSASRPKDHT